MNLNINIGSINIVAGKCFKGDFELGDEPDDGVIQNVEADDTEWPEDRYTTADPDALVEQANEQGMKTSRVWMLVNPKTGNVCFDSDAGGLLLIFKSLEGATRAQAVNAKFSAHRDVIRECVLILPSDYAEDSCPEEYPTKEEPSHEEKPEPAADPMAENTEADTGMISSLWILRSSSDGPPVFAIDSLGNPFLCFRSKADAIASRLDHLNRYDMDCTIDEIKLASPVRPFSVTAPATTPGA